MCLAPTAPPALRGTSPSPSAPHPTGIPKGDDVPKEHRDDMLRNGAEDGLSFLPAFVLFQEEAVVHFLAKYYTIDSKFKITDSLPAQILNLESKWVK